MRSTVVDALHSPHGYWYLVVSPSTVSSTYVITVDINTGNPLYTGIPFVDVFPDHSIALKAVTERGAKAKIHGEGLLGIACTENATTIGIIDKTEVTAIFPPDHKIRTIRHVHYIQIPFKKGAPKNSVYDDFQLVDNHFVCDTYDLTRLFPVVGTDNPDLGFIWNNGWRKPFVALGIPQACIYLIQGVCVSKHFESFGFTLCYLARRSVLNPGTRYAARGLNDLNSPGNEVECELLFFKGEEFWSEKWRRGSIPIKWKTILNSKLGSPKHRVDTNYFDGTVDYFKMLTERFGDIPIRCISLLQTEADHAENEIKEFFTKALHQLFDHGIENVIFTPFDLNAHLHADGSGEAMMDFLSYVAPLGDNDGFTQGTLPSTVTKHQNGMMRFNCADSLDRTNLATFYYAMKFTAEWCKERKVGLSATPDADPNQPNLIIDQTIIDFLASAFVDSGNVVSRLYTNTPAIKVNAIKKFSPSIVVTQSDTNITLQRRMQNVVNDPGRQKLIEMWTQPPSLSWFHRLDPAHIFVVPNFAGDGTGQFPRDIFGPEKHQFDISAKESLVCLPAPMVIFSFMLLMYPANQKLHGVTISGGLDLEHMEPVMHIMLPAVESATWLRYRPSMSVRCGLEKIPVKYIRFLSFTFDTEDDKFSIGNLRIEGKSIFCGEPATIPRRLRDGDDNSSEFRASFDDFLKTPMKLNDVLELEKIRITLNIQESLRNQLALEKGVSPWCVDSRSQLIAAPKKEICAFCRQPIPNETTPRYFTQASHLPSLLAESTSEKDGFPVCRNCVDQAEIIAQITSAYEEEFIPVELPMPHFEKGNASHELNERNQAYTNEATSAFMNRESSLLWSAGGSEKLAPQESKEFDLFIVQQAIIFKIVVATKASEQILQIIDENGNQLDAKRVDDEHIEFTFKEQPITQKLKFTLKNSSEDTEIEVTQAHAYYIITEFQIEEAPNHPEEKLESPKLSNEFYTREYNSSTRTDTFKMNKTSNVYAMFIETVVHKTSTSPLSFYLALYNENNLVKKIHFILPEATNGSKMWYRVGKGGVEADVVKVFYSDRIAALKPHKIGLVVK